MANHQPVTVESLRRLDVFAGLADPPLRQLLGAATLLRLSARQPISAEAAARPSGGRAEKYCFVVDGGVAIALRHGGALGRGPADASDGRSDLEYIGYFDRGMCFSDGFLADQGSPQAGVVDCIATTDTTLLQLETPVLAGFMGKHGSWGHQLSAHVSEARGQFLKHQEPGRRIVQDFYVRQNLPTSTTVRVRRLDHCLDCNKCYDACAARHGTSRMIRSGPILGRLGFPTVCHRCEDKPCLNACGFGALTVDESSGDVKILESCAGCGACAARCPNGAISMIMRPYTVKDFPDPLPINDARRMTNVANLFVAGDVSGAGLIRVAMNHAVEAVDAIGARLAPPHPRLLDVAIVGGGPAGLAAALRCQERQLSYVVLEKERLASTIRDYPKNKHVMAEPSTLPLRSALWFQDCSKEELLEHWQRAVAEQRIRIEEGAEVRQLQDEGGRFRLLTSRGDVYAENVVVCIGKRGSPRRLGVAGEAAPRVRYVLSDPEEFAGKSVLVVGGGDSAIEAAMSLADVPGTHVTLSYRRNAFTRAKARNRQVLERYAAEGRIDIVLGSTLSAIEPGAVTIESPTGGQRIANDAILALLGAEPPTAFLQQCGIRVLQPGSDEMARYAATLGQRQQALKCDGCTGFDDRACVSACPTKALVEVPTRELFTEPPPAQSRLRRFSDAPFVGAVWSSHPAVRARGPLHVAVIALLLLGLVVTGVESFLRAAVPQLSLAARYAEWTGQQTAVTFSSGKGFGHWLGYIGTGAMLASVLYSLRSRMRRFSGLGSQSGWLSAHLWLGFAGGTLVTYHSALKLDRWASIACILIWVIVLTGAIGRYMYGRVHSAKALAEFELHALRRRCLAFAPPEHRTGAIRTLLTEPPRGRNAAALLAMALLWHELRDRLLLLGLWLFGARHLSSRRDRRDFLRALGQWTTNRRRSTYYDGTQAMLRHWNIVHIVLAILMFVLAGIHIVYGWIYKAV